MAVPDPEKLPAPLTVKLRIALLQLSPVETGLIPLTMAAQEFGPVFTLRLAGQTMLGKVVSSTVTLKEHEDEFPLTSVTIKLSDCVPLWLQWKSVLVREVPATPHASVDPAFA